MRLVSQVIVQVPRCFICSIKSPNVVVKWLKGFWNWSTYDRTRGRGSPVTWVGSPCRFGIFHHPAWAVGSYRSGPPAAGTVRSKSTGGFYQGDVSLCTEKVNLKTSSFGWLWSLRLQRDFPLFLLALCRRLLRQFLLVGLLPPRLRLGRPCCSSTNLANISCLSKDVLKCGL